MKSLEFITEAITVSTSEYNGTPSGDEVGSWTFTDHKRENTYSNVSYNAAVKRAKQDFGRNTSFLKIYLIGKK